MANRYYSDVSPNPDEEKEISRKKSKKKDKDESKDQGGKHESF